LREVFVEDLRKAPITVVPSAPSGHLVGIQQQVDPQSVNQCLDASHHRNRIEGAIGAARDNLAAHPGYLGKSLVVISVMDLQKFGRYLAYL
jgi:hypothetical protein